MAMVQKKIKQSARDIDREKVRETYKNEKVLVDKIGFRLSKDKVLHINESIKNYLLQHPNY